MKDLRPKIACQLYPIEKKRGMPLFDLQIIGFLDFKTTSLIAIVTSFKGFLARPFGRWICQELGIRILYELRMAEIVQGLISG